MKDIHLSVVIPCFNEMANLQKGVLDRVEHFLSKQSYTYEVVIVDDGSGDGSAEFIEAFVKEYPHFTLIQNPHTGKAGAVTAGMLKSHGEYRLFTDMDQATPIEEVNQLLPFTESFDIVIGSRNSKRKGSPWTRIIMAKGMVLSRVILVGLREISDTQCGFKLFRGGVAEKIFTKIEDLHHGFKKISGSAVTAGFDVELLYLAEKMGYTIKEVSVDWLYVETRRVSPLKDSLDALQDLIRIRFNAMRKR